MWCGSVQWENLIIEIGGFWGRVWGFEVNSGGTCGIGGLYHDRGLVWGGVGSGLSWYRG